MTVLELNDIQNANRLLVDSFPVELLYSKDYNCRKIDIYSNGNYVCSTNASKTLKIAKARLLAKHWLSYSCTKVTAKFAN